MAWESGFTADDVIGILKAIHDDWSSESMQEMLKNNRDWALSQSWESLAKEWLHQFSLSTTCLD
jgi:hypothetical protein